MEETLIHKLAVSVVNEHIRMILSTHNKKFINILKNDMGLCMDDENKYVIIDTKDIKVDCKGNMFYELSTQIKTKELFHFLIKQDENYVSTNQCIIYYWDIIDKIQFNETHELFESLKVEYNHILQLKTFEDIKRKLVNLVRNYFRDKDTKYIITNSNCVVYTQSYIDNVRRFINTVSTEQLRPLIEKYR